MLDRILEESTNNINIDIADAWAINAKNSLTNVHGFSPYQLAIGHNLILPCAATSRPALTHTLTSKILKENLCYLHQSRQAFIESENSEQIRRALNHNIRTYSDTCKAKMDNKSWSNMVQTMSDYTHAISPLIVIQ